MKRWSNTEGLKPPEAPKTRRSAPKPEHQPPVEEDAAPPQPTTQTAAEKLDAYEDQVDRDEAARAASREPTVQDQKKVQQQFEKLTADEVLAEAGKLTPIEDEDVNYDALTAMMEREGSLMIAIDKLALRFSLAKHDFDTTEDRLKRFTMAAMEARKRVLMKKGERLAFIKSGIRHGMEQLGEKSMKTMCGTSISILYPTMHTVNLEVSEDALIKYCLEKGKQEDWADFIEPVTTYKFSKAKFKARLKAYVEEQKKEGNVPDGQEVTVFVKAANLFPGVVATPAGNSVRIRQPKGFDAITLADAHGTEGMRYLEEVIETGYRPEKEGDRASE